MPKTVWYLLNPFLKRIPIICPSWIETLLSTLQTASCILMWPQTRKEANGRTQRFISVCGKSSKEISALALALFNFLKDQKPNPYVALVALSDVVGLIIEKNFHHCEDAQHLATLTEQTLEGYNNTIIHAAEGIMRARFNESLIEEDDNELYSKAIGSC